MAELTASKFNLFTKYRNLKLKKPPSFAPAVKKLKQESGGKTAADKVKV